jgi:hypothetical protein
MGVLHEWLKAAEVVILRWKARSAVVTAQGSPVQVVARL